MRHKIFISENFWPMETMESKTVGILHGVQRRNAARVPCFTTYDLDLFSKNYIAVKVQ